MANMPWYWDYPSSTTSYWNRSNTNAGTSWNTPDGRFFRNTTQTGSTHNGWSSNNPNFIYRIVYEHYLIEEPEHWTDADAADFVFLINDATSTGCKVALRIKGGDIAITDPNVHKRSMADFLPLLLSWASAADQATIRAFFEAHPIVRPDDAADPAA